MTEVVKKYTKAELVKEYEAWARFLYKQYKKEKLNKLMQEEKEGLK